MSLERALDELTAEIRRLQLVLPKITASAPTVPTLQDTTTALTPVAESVKKRKEKPAIAGEVQGSISLPAIAVAPEPAEPRAPLADEGSVDRAAQLTLQLVAKHGRAAAVALLTRFNVTKTVDLPAERLLEYALAAEQELAR